MLPLLQPPRPKLPPQQHTGPVYDCAVRHPVFFSRALFKPPFALAANDKLNPVAHGYISETNNKKKEAKL
ncbi:hypothetical protein IWX90DRAFT_488493 [Phyllosticta citrichinensis]|uniref:Uncharacterized protein n=1 Tax=Phyllosticta citrichinensis TaxID=1130410 RepID=A0ABR1XP54_9PEZI